ncbi:MAG: MOSC domain-containing protein [Candidatus Xenobia bacterium]
MSKLVSIVYKPAAGKGEHGYLRCPLQQAVLQAGYGIEGDAKGGKAGRQLNVMGTPSLVSLAAEGFLTAPGQLGEQLIVDLDVDALPVGTRIHIGPTACVELLEPRTGCGRFDQYQGKSHRVANGRLGMMAAVVDSGRIAVGDRVSVSAADLAPQSPQTGSAT